MRVHNTRRYMGAKFRDARPEPVPDRVEDTPSYNRGRPVSLGNNNNNDNNNKQSPRGRLMIINHLVKKLTSGAWPVCAIERSDWPVYW